MLVSGKMYSDWAISSFLDTRADFQKTYEKQAKECAARNAWVVKKNPNLSGVDLQNSRGLGAYDVILEGITSIQAEFLHHQTHLDSDRCLLEVAGLHRLFNDNLRVKQWWQGGRFEPPWERESSLEG